ncbi:SatD family protein [Pontibacter liquoris]|uniref:SatD family protein n=1 Tax=Pontibacter liquoris TaxID=2905677 RepID=UPI001FA6EB01|nr:SatD family protein [Pontibacter liquoris]
MTSIITGDIINSRKAGQPRVWLDVLKAELNQVGQEPKVWEIYRGDSFQVEVQEVADALKIAIKLKAAIKTVKGLDVRMAIGIGEKSFEAPKITEANGDAFVRSGRLFEQLKKDTLAISSPWPDVDAQLNLMLDLALLTMDNWTQNSAEIVKLSLELPEATQTELANKLGITQGRISDRQKRAGYDAIMRLEKHYCHLIHAILPPTS